MLVLRGGARLVWVTGSCAHLIWLSQCSPRRMRAAEQEAYVLPDPGSVATLPRLAPLSPAPFCERQGSHVPHSMEAAASFHSRPQISSLISKVRPCVYLSIYYRLHVERNDTVISIRIATISLGALVSRWHGSKWSLPLPFLHKYWCFWSAMWGFFDVTYIEL